jgi:hypothetical protein
MAHQEEWLTKAAAARCLGYSRRTVQRYCNGPWADPSLVKDGKVNVQRLKSLVDFRLSTIERRGFPLGRERPQRRLELGRVPKKKKGFNRSLYQRIEIIRREIDAMTDGQQVQLVLSGPDTFLKMIRPQAFIMAEKLRQSSGRAESDHLP